MKLYSRTKRDKKLGFRTPNAFRVDQFMGKRPPLIQKFNPAQFKTQHRG